MQRPGGGEYHSTFCLNLCKWRMTNRLVREHSGLCGKTKGETEFAVCFYRGPDLYDSVRFNRHGNTEQLYSFKDDACGHSVQFSHLVMSDSAIP